VVAGTTLAFMGLTYLVLPLIFQRQVMFPKLAKVQPYLFAIGVGGISLFMMGAGTLGVSRRHWDITFSDAPLSFDYPAAAQLMLALNGIFAIMAAIGGGLYIFITVMSVLFGKKVDASNIKAALGPMPTPQVSSAVRTYGSAGTLNLPGTYILVTIFFTAFVLYYFVNWKYLSELWPMG
jgi:cytochrome c oxidase subunit 1